MSSPLEAAPVESCTVIDGVGAEFERPRGSELIHFAIWHGRDVWKALSYDVYNSEVKGLLEEDQEESRYTSIVRYCSGLCMPMTFTISRHVFSPVECACESLSVCKMPDFHTCV